MKKTDFLPLSAGAIVGVLIAAALFGGKREPQAQTMQINLMQAGQALSTNAKMRLIQAGTPVGSLSQGAKLWLRPDAAPGERLQLLLEWNGSETFDTLFRPVVDDGQPANRKASVSLETQR